MAKRSFDDFDKYANDYRSIHTDNVKLSGADSFYFAEHKVQQLMGTEAGNTAVRMLDIGCGDGATELFIQQYQPSWTVEAIDISEKSIARAGEKKITNANFSVYDGKQIPFADNSFDIAFIAAVMHHIDFSLHECLLKEILRVLKPGGRIYLFEHNPLNPVTRYLVNTCVFDKDAKLLGYNYSNRLLNNAGFKNIKKKFILFFPRSGMLARLIKLEDKLGWLPLGGQYLYKAEK
ncbi:class I SAM-dependent methyltransferase [soil metagenome]